MTAVRGPDLFTKYYKDVIGEERWEDFWATLHRPLPTAIRLSQVPSLRSQQLFAPILKGLEKARDDNLLDLKPIPWMDFRDQNKGQCWGWQFTVSRSSLRSEGRWKVIHEQIEEGCQAGAFSRQEAVSMLPPMPLLPLPRSSKILDICASPGSKTSQVIEALMGDSGSAEQSDGLIVANDLTLPRCSVLVTNTRGYFCPSLIVVNQDGTQLRTGSKTRFDGIICDVPCSSDGTIRKNKSVLDKWEILSGVRLHRLQVEIASHAMKLLKPGGLLVYSTCSFNPVENEAVVCEVLLTDITEPVAHPSNKILRRFPDVEIEDVRGKLPNLKANPGLSTWKVWDYNDGSILKCAEDVAVRRRGKLPASLFPPSAAELSSERMPLDKCVRLFPPSQDTGGFFITGFRKREAESSVSIPKPISSKPRKDENDFVFQFVSDTPELLKHLKDYYGLPDNFPFDRLVFKTGKKAEDFPNRIHVVSKPVVDQIRECGTSLRGVVAGLQVFDKEHAKTGNGAHFRVVYEGAAWMRNWATLRNFKISAGDANFLLHFGSETIPTEAITNHSPELNELLSSTSGGVIIWTELSKKMPADHPTKKPRKEGENCSIESSILNFTALCHGSGVDIRVPKQYLNYIRKVMKLQSM